MKEMNGDFLYLSEISISSDISNETSLRYQSLSINNNSNTNMMIILNARGFKYEVPLDSFKRAPRSRLGKIRKYLLNNNIDEIKQLCDRFNPDLKEIYFNRDPFVLNNVLNFYQNGKLHMNHSECVMFIRDEIDYWHINNDHSFETCCQLNFNEKLEETESLIETRNDLFEKINNLDENFGVCLPNLREKLWNLFDDPSSSIFAKLLFIFSTFTVLLLIFIISNVFIFLLLYIYAWELILYQVSISYCETYILGNMHFKVRIFGI